MNTHYIPRFILKHFLSSNRINLYDFITESFCDMKIKNTFVEKDLYEPELERAFATKLEGPIGNLLNNKLLVGKDITINRKENLLLRKFLMINNLRSPIINCSWDEMVEKRQLQNHPTVQAVNFMSRHHSEFKEIFHNSILSDTTFLEDLKTAMDCDSLEDILIQDNISSTLRMSTKQAIVTGVAFWDCEGTGQEFILPKVSGVSVMDTMGIFHKLQIINNKRKELEQLGVAKYFKPELDRLTYGSMIYSDNFSINPISPTRAVICFSPYFRAFFPIRDCSNTIEMCPYLLDREQFDRHFYEPMRMELFRPCEVVADNCYSYDVKTLTAKEVKLLNSILLEMESEEFVFRSYDKIKDSLFYYDNKAKFVTEKKHNFGHIL